MAKLSLAQMAVVPPAWLCTQEAVPGNPQPGGTVLHRVRGAQQLDCFGVFWNVQDAPVGYGFVNTVVGDLYDRTILTFQQLHLDSNGDIMATVNLETNLGQGYFMFDEYPLYGLSLLCAPGVTVNLFWLVVFT